MSENQNEVGDIIIPQEDLDKLPKNTVHCFPASKTQILRRRIITVILMLGVGAALGYLLYAGEKPSLLIWLVTCAVFIISLVVFIHTFVIGKYRVAMDYQKNEVVLRYMFSKITIPFDSFDVREGAADRATVMLQNSALGASLQNNDYMVLDNVYAEVCYQTSSKDLATKEDYDTLLKEAKLVASVFKAKEKYDALNTDEDENSTPVSSDELTALVQDAIKEDKAEKAAEQKAKQAKALEEAEKILKEDAEAAEAAKDEAVEEVSEKIEEAEDAVEEASEKVEEIAEKVEEAVDEDKKEE